MATRVGSLLIDMSMNVARLQSDVSQAKDVVARGMGEIKSAVDSAKSALALLGVGLSVGAFKGMIDGVIESTEKLHDLSMASGATVESLSEMRSIAKLSGTDIESGIVPALQKLAAKMLEAQTGSGEASKAFAALGLSVVDAGGKLKDNGEFMVELAGKLSGLENATQRVALAKATLGKAGATLLPFLKDLAENYEHVGKITAEQAALADNYKDTLVKLGFASAATKKEFVLGLLPAMNDIAEAMLGAKEKGGGLLSTMKSLREDGSIDSWAQSAIKWLALMADTALFLAKSFRQVVESVSTVGIEGAALLSRAAASNPIVWAQNKMLGDPISKLQGFASDWSERTNKNMLDRWGDGTGLNTPTLDFVSKAFDSRRDVAVGARGTGAVDIDAMGKDRATKDSGFDTLKDQLVKKLELEKNSTELEKLNLDLLREKYALITPKQAEELRMLAAQVDLKLQEKAISAAALKYAEDMIKLDEERNKQITDFNQSWSEYKQNLEFETSQLGLNATQIATGNALRRLKLEWQKASVNLEGEEFEKLKAIYDRNRELLPELIAQNEARKEAVDRQKQLLDETKRMNESIGNSLTDALLRGFESGKSFAKSFRDMLVNMFKTLVLRPIIQPIAMSAAMAVTGALGLPGTAGASGGGVGIGDIYSLGKAAASSGAAFNSFGGYDIGATSLDALQGSSAFSGLTDLFSSGAGNSLGGSLAGSAGGLSGVLPYAGALLQLAGGNVKGAAISGGLTYAGGAMFGPVGAAAGAILGGLLGGGGGGTPAVLTSKDMPGGYAGYASGLGGAVMGNDANQGYRWQGETWSGAFTTEIQGVYAEVERLGKLLGKDTSQLRSVGAQIKTGAFNNPAEILPTVLDQLGTTLARSIIPNFDQLAVAGESATQTLMRLTEAQKTALEDQRSSLMASLPNFLRDLSGKLGITGLQNYKDALSVSDYQTPLDRYSAARGLLNNTYSSAMGGDLSAVSAFPQLLQQALGIGRDVFASGPEFQSLFVEGNRQLNELLAKQQNTMQEMTAGLPVTIMEASQNEIVALREQTKALVSSLTSIEDQLRLLREAA